jgi:hypothetical protein
VLSFRNKTISGNRGAMLEYYDGWIRRNGSLIEIGHWQHGTPVSSRNTY